MRIPRVVLTVRLAAAPVVSSNALPVPARTGVRPPQLRFHVRVQLPGVPGQLLLEAFSARLPPAVTLMTGPACTIAAVGSSVIDWVGCMGGAWVHLKAFPGQGTVQSTSKQKDARQERLSLVAGPHQHAPGGAAAQQSVASSVSLPASIT